MWMAEARRWSPWLHHLAEESLDLASTENFDHFWEADLCTGQRPEPCPSDHRQIAVTGIMVEDTTVLELAHRRQLINAGVLATDPLLLLQRPRPHGP